MAGRAASLCAVLLLSSASAAEPAPARRAGATPARDAAAGVQPAASERSCSGEYADFLSSMNGATRALEGVPGAGSTYLLRNVATYEHVYYGTGGRLRRQYLRHVRHGTGFAYRAERGEWYVATNQHVAEHPLVTASDDDVEGIPAGSRKVRETVRLVTSDDDDDDGGPVMVKVLADEALDLAVLKTTRPLAVMPYRFGRSAALRVGNAVVVRGYPLGAFAATNSGRVISTGQPDRERGWAHEDFAVDALLNSGNSGSPVFAVSCRTGELELVGIYHAGYRDAQALNVVVSIDQLRPVLESLQAPRRDAHASRVRRAEVVERLRAAASPLLMPFGDRVVRVELSGTAVRFAVLDPDYPLTSHADAELVDHGADEPRPVALLAARRGAGREVPWETLPRGVRAATDRLDEALWAQLSAVLAYREAEARGRRTSEARGVLAAMAGRLRAARDEQKELLQSVDFDAAVGVEPPPGMPTAAAQASTWSAPEHAGDDD